MPFEPITIPKILNYKLRNVGRQFNLLTVIAGFQQYGNRYYLCRCECGREISVGIGDISRKLSCGCAKGKEAWDRAKNKGISPPKPCRYPLASGYVMRKAHKGHPFADANGYVLEHRLVVEKSIGRYLEKDEHVHHRNNIPWDNRLKNLEVWIAFTQPRGARVTDVVAHCIEMLMKYAPEVLR